jgi:CRP-like cAMP-binding protein
VVLLPLMRGIDEGGPAGARRVALIRAQPDFAGLSLAAVEHLAGSLVPVTYEDGATVIREGAPGSDYILIDSGVAEVSQDGLPIRTLGPGAGVGEIALLLDTPRTASVTAVGPVAAFRLDRAAFLAAVSGLPGAGGEASARAERHLTADADRARLH